MNDATQNQPTPKLFGRYHEIVLLLLGFILTTICGTVLTHNFQSQAQDKDRRETRRTESVRFLVEVANDVNKPFSRITTQLRARNKYDTADIGEEIGTLFTKRLGTKVMNHAYLRSDRFWKDYDLVTWELHNITTQLQDLKAGTTTSKDVAAFARERIELLRKNSALETVTKNEHLGTPYDEMMELRALLWDYTSRFLEAEVTDAIDR